MSFLSIHFFKTVLIGWTTIGERTEYSFKYLITLLATLASAISRLMSNEHS